MNFEFNPSNVDFGNPNAPVSNPVGTQAIPQIQPPSITNTPQVQKKNQSYYEKIMSIFNNKTGTILATAIGMAIGFSFKDLITSAVGNVLQPIIILLLSYSPFLNDYLNLSSYISQKNTTLNIPNFISDIVSFILTIIAVYYINAAISVQI
jgi:large-conductance mechanosensitive channel